ncbi:MAG: hypothetical protein JXR07_01530 [Reichenbachiella sp.]
MNKIFTIFLLSFFTGDLSDISKKNSLKKNAEVAFIKGDYEEASKHYSYLLDTMAVTDEAATMNYAHANFKLGNVEEAQRQYQKLVLSKDKKMKSLAYQQLGAVSNDPKTLEKAMSYFKESIKNDPTNDDARYNYELVKKKLNEQDQNKEDNQDQNQDDQDKKDQDQEKDQEKQDQENKDQKGDKEDQSEQENQEQQDQEKQDQEQQDQEQQDQEEQNRDQEGEEEGKEEEQNQPQEDEQKDGEEKEEQQSKSEEENKEEGKENQPPAPSTADKLEEMNISEEKAKMILEALKNSEIQYIQQNRRAPTKKKDSDKPDW